MPDPNNIPVINLPQLNPQASTNPFGTALSLPLAGMSIPRSSQVAQGYHIAPPSNPFSGMQNPRNFGGFGQGNATPTPARGFGVSGGIGTPFSKGNASVGNDNGMSADEMKWAGIAQKMGLDWNTTKAVYMNPARNGTPNVSQALGRQMDDKIWGDVFFQYTGHPPNEQEWIEHYNAGGNMAYDPLRGHNEAINEIARRQQEIENQFNPPQAYPDWYK